LKIRERKLIKGLVPRKEKFFKEEARGRTSCCRGNLEFSNNWRMKATKG